MSSMNDQHGVHTVMELDLFAAENTVAWPSLRDGCDVLFPNTPFAAGRGGQYVNSEYKDRSRRHDGLWSVCAEQRG